MEFEIPTHVPPNLPLCAGHHRTARNATGHDVVGVAGFPAPNGDDGSVLRSRFWLGVQRDIRRSHYRRRLQWDIKKGALVFLSPIGSSLIGRAKHLIVLVFLIPFGFPMPSH